MSITYRCAVPLLLALLTNQAAAASYANVTLTSNDLSVVIFLPAGIKPDENTYYKGSRFEHGSMIGEIQRSKIVNGEPVTNVLYGADLWRQPHNSSWTESGLGLASEFGCGDDWTSCPSQWSDVENAINGVLGHDEAETGEEFLKIGVGKLLKAACEECGTEEDRYRFNSPYPLVDENKWTMLPESGSANTVVLEQAASVKTYGYVLRKDITLNGNELLVKTSLTNTGEEPFTTPWYSHHFFNCDNDKIGVGYSVDLDLTGTGGSYVDSDPSWATPLGDYATTTVSGDVVSTVMTEDINDDKVKIKALFDKDETSQGEFTLHGCGHSITEQTLEESGEFSLYAYNLYIEEGTLSPEPLIVFSIAKDETVSFVQRLVFEDDSPAVQGDSTEAQAEEL